MTVVLDKTANQLSIPFDGVQIKQLKYCTC
jgi:hypothetical protein